MNSLFFCRRPALPTASILRCLTMACLATLLGCSKPEPIVPEARPTIAGELITFPGNQNPTTLRLVTVASPGDHPVTLPGRLAWDEDHTSRVYAPYAGRVERLLVGVGERVRQLEALDAVAV